MQRTAMDGDFQAHVGSTETSFDAFLSAMGMSVEEVEGGKSISPDSEAPQPFADNFDINAFYDEEAEAGDEAEQEEEVEDEDEDQDELDGSEEESETDEENEESDTDEEQEEEEVDFGELEIDMDSEIQIGDDYVSINELIRNRIKREELDAKVEEAERLSTELLEKETTLSTALDKAMLECDKVIDDYKTFDWKKLAAEDPTSYAQHREFLEAYLARKEEIEEEYVKSKQVEENKVKEARQEEINAAVKTLKSAIPEWNDTLYGSMMDYAIKQLGMSEKFVTESVDVGFFKTIHSLMKRDKDLKMAVTKVRKPAVKKVAKSAAPTKAAKKATPRKSSTASEAGINSYDASSYNAFAKLGIK